MYEKMFFETKPAYEFIEHKRCLKRVDDVNQQELIQSYEDCALESQLKKFGFIQPVPEDSLKYGNVDYERDAISALNDLITSVEVYRLKAGLSPYDSFDSVVRHLEKNSLELKAQIEKIKNKEVKADESQKIEQKIEQQDI